jgi:hypothetical protein
MATTVVEYSQQDRLDRLHKLFLRYKTRTEKGVEDGYLFFSPVQVIDHAIKMAAWHLEQDELAARELREAERQ